MRATPLPLTASLALNADATLLRHIEQGGVRILLYGGNANVYHIDRGRFRDLLALLVAQAGPDTAVLPSIGPDLGRMLDFAPLLRDAGFRHAMALPAGFPSDPAGIERGLRLAVEAIGFGLVLYVKRETYLEPWRIERLVRDGAVTFVKYAVERPDPFGDAYLADIVEAVGAERVASGMGETPLQAHLPVLHDAVTLSGVADMGPILPMVSNVAAADRDAVRAVTNGLLDVEASCGEARRRRSA